MLGIYTDAAELQKTRPWQYTRPGEEPTEHDAILHLRPFTRTTQGIVERKAKAKGIEVMDADAALAGIGQGDKKAEAFMRVLFDFLIAEWENVVTNNAFFDGERHFDVGAPLPCELRFKVMLIEDMDLAVRLINQAKAMATLQVGDETKNSVRSSGGEVLGGNSLNPASA